MVGDKILSSKTDFNTWLSASILSDSEEFISKESNYGRSIGNLIVFAINILNIVESEVGYYCCINCSSLSLACSSDSSKFTF